MYNPNSHKFLIWLINFMQILPNIHFDFYNMLGISMKNLVIYEFFFMLKQIIFSS